MTNNLDMFDEQEEELKRQMEATLEKLNNIKLQKEALRIELEKSKSVVAQVILVAQNAVNIKISDDRADINTYLLTIPGRFYSYSNGINAIPLVEWNNFITQFKSLPNTSIIISEEQSTKINKILYAPNFEITKTERYLKVETNANADTKGITNIPGANYDHRLGGYIIPLTEGYKLFNFCKLLPETQTIIWSKEATDFVAGQVERRMKIDEIALAKNWDIKVPGLNATLKPYQNVGVAFFDANGGSGILGDDMGLGKTIQGIAVALKDTRRCVVVAPAGLKINWSRQIKKFTNESIYIVQGGTPTMYDMSLLLSRDCPRFIIINYDIFSKSVVVDKSFVDEDGIKHEKKEEKYPWIEIFNLMELDLIIYDEAHYLKNMGSNRSQASRQVQAKRTLCLTGTPVMNRPNELWPMLHLIDEVTFPSFERFVNQYTVDGKTVRNAEELKDLLKPLMIRRLHKDVTADLPKKNRIDEYYELSAKAKKLYTKVLNGVYENITTGKEENVANILVQIQRLKQICAIDKVPATADLATRIYDSSDPSERPKKVLIFSQFKATAYAIRTRLGSEAIGFVGRNSNKDFITADPAEQDRLVQQFQNDPDIHYLIVTEKTAKEGHDITQAMAVIFNDLFWTPAGHQQAEGRAYMRASDPHGIDSYYHIAEGTIDDWINELLADKLAIIENVVDGVNDSRINPNDSIIKDIISNIKNGFWKK